MRAQRFIGLTILVLIVLLAVIVKQQFYPDGGTGLSETVFQEVVDDLRRLERLKVQKQQKQIEYETALILDKQGAITWWRSMKYYGGVTLLATVSGSFLILTICYSRAVTKAKSVFFAHIGKHSDIPIHYKDLQSFYPIAVNLSLAEIEASISTQEREGFQLSRQLVEDVTAYTRALVGRRGLIQLENQTKSAVPSLPEFSEKMSLTPSLADLLRSNKLTPGAPLILGYNQGTGKPEYRTLKAVKTMAVAGWQGSGKTMSTAYFIAASLLCDGVKVFVVDPHQNHDEGLYHLIQPLESTGFLQVINPFYVKQLIAQLNQTLDRRLSGQESSEQGILLVIDELAGLAKLEVFSELITFLERCTEETRKANITFAGCSQKWTARHFKGRADIRGCMNSMLIHKTKPSQADLLLEDTQEKHLVKQLEQPGDAILCSDYGQATVVRMPFCEREDMVKVSKMIQHSQPVIDLSFDSVQVKSVSNQVESVKSLPEHQLTPEFFNAQISSGEWSQRRIEKATKAQGKKIPQTRISLFSQGHADKLTREEKDVIYQLLTTEESKPESLNHIVLPPQNQMIQ
ncbi:MAG: ATP-binding protein [Deltaproteobacteria bacterium]|nr:ATP-binding protein [Deltaproteobacteria bacterium]